MANRDFKLNLKVNTSEFDKELKKVQSQIDKLNKKQEKWFGNGIQRLEIYTKLNKLNEQAVELEKQKAEAITRQINAIKEQEKLQDKINQLNSFRNVSLDKMPSTLWTNFKQNQQSKLNDNWSSMQTRFVNNSASLVKLKSNPTANKDKISSLQNENSSLMASMGKLTAGSIALSTGFGVLEWAGNKVKDAFETITKGIGDAYDELISFKDGLATYSFGSSLITNSKARDTALKYGLSSGETYAYTQASNLLGITDENDLMYMNSAQRSKFQEYMNKYTNMYDNLEKTGVLEDIQDLQLQFEEFKIDFAQQLLTFVANNKDLIIGACQGIMNILTFVGDIFTTLNGSSNYSETSTTKLASGTYNTITVNIDNSNSNNSADDLGDAIVNKLNYLGV